MRPFSERIGLAKPRPAAQIGSIDEPLRVGLWNALSNNHFTHVIRDEYAYGRPAVYPTEELQATCRALWMFYFQKPIDTLPHQWDEIYSTLRKYFFAAPWNEVYDFVEFIPKAFRDSEVNENFYRECNGVLQREQSAYRFVNGNIVGVVDPVEIQAVESASELPRGLKTVGAHLASALTHMSDRKSPDYRNSIKESISAVEGMCALITGQEKSDLNSALRELEKRAGLHGALKSAFNSLYGFTSDSNGIRHALLNESDLTFDDAKFMLVTCSAFVNYLKVLVEKAGIKV